MIWDDDRAPSSDNEKRAWLGLGDRLTYSVKLKTQNPWDRQSGPFRGRVGSSLRALSQAVEALMSGAKN